MGSRCKRRSAGRVSGTAVDRGKCFVPGKGGSVVNFKKLISPTNVALLALLGVMAAVLAYFVVRDWGR